MPGNDLGNCPYAIPNCRCEEDEASPFVHGRLEDQIGPGDEEDDDEEYDDDEDVD